MIYRPQSLPLASPCAELTSSVKPKECGVILTCRPSVLVRGGRVLSRLEWTLETCMWTIVHGTWTMTRASERGRA